MNIALSAVILFILLVPPIAFYLAFSFGQYPRATPKFSIIEGLLATAVVSLVIHSIGIIIINYFYSEIRFDILIKLLGGDLKDFRLSNNLFNRYILQFTWYNFILLAIFAGLGRLFRMQVQRRGIHFTSPVFRLYNRWWYLFNRTADESDIPFIDVAVDTKEGTVIYSGFLVNYICHEEELDRIYLTATIRRDFKKVQAPGTDTIMLVQEGEATAIAGDTFVIPYSSAINFNITYYASVEDGEEETPEEETLEEEKVA